MVFDWVEWFGYLASLVVLISLTMTSIIKLRVINFIGCLLFAAFAYFINSYPTMLMNLGIAGINIYYLWGIYKSEDRFKLISTTVDSEYFDHFVATNLSEIERQASISIIKTANTAFYTLRNNSIAGLLVGDLDKEGTFSLTLDYVTPEYRDMKLAKYFYLTHPEAMKEKGVTTLKAYAKTEDHEKYLLNLGFTLSKKEEDFYLKEL